MDGGYYILILTSVQYEMLMNIGFFTGMNINANQGSFVVEKNIK